ncbi:hypothetical protein L1987_75068 [Smallanthus sonchifolius]|uniref:Uncharacterized protein n=1 Tax=Smallanthus sonchifolius TaxID=185202 RepID=A0ACB9A4F5_9ASTR|nr:hypothetical protein L1987_75068 [Smallanthus sonchifolius]
MGFFFIRHDSGEIEVLLLSFGDVVMHLSEVTNKALLFLVRSELEMDQVCEMTKLQSFICNSCLGSGPTIYKNSCGNGKLFVSWRFTLHVAGHALLHIVPLFKSRFVSNVCKFPKPAATGSGFIARDMTFENYAGPANHQAVALRIGADHAVVYRCDIIGYQDTLYVHSNRQFFRECNIYGTVDFIFGNAAVVFQNCNMYARKPMAQQKVSITAQNRKDPNQNTGISIHACRLLAQPDLEASKASFPTYLGRPWKLYSRTVYMQSYMGDHIHPRGWLEWDGTFALDTLYYGEYMNSGPGSATGQRVKWPGYRVITTTVEAIRFTVGQFIYGSSWLPSTGVAFSAGLS